MDGRDQRARPGPEHTPVAGDVQHIESRAAHEAGQHRLMPENVSERRPVALRHRCEMHRGGGEAEQRQVFLEDEEGEFVGGGRGEERAHQRQHILPDPGVSALDDGGGEADLHGRGGRYSEVGVGLVGL